jgi:hypothetical protein
MCAGKENSFLQQTYQVLKKVYLALAVLYISIYFLLASDPAISLLFFFSIIAKVELLRSEHPHNQSKGGSNGRRK